MRETWKDVVGYEGIYKVSNAGRVKSKITNKVLKQFVTKSGYCKINLYKNKVPERCLVHRLVATAFIENNNNYPIINHKDENPGNNRVDNLEWCTYSYNTCYGTARERAVMHTDYKKRTENMNWEARNAKLKKPIIQLKDGVIIKEFDSIKSAVSEYGGVNAHGSNIIEVCKGRRKKAYGFEWRYKNGQR